MTAALDILDRARQHGIAIEACGDRLKLKAPAKPPDDLLEQIRAHKPDIVSLLQPASDEWTSEDWQAYFNERAAHIEYEGGESRPQAEARAYECCITEWLNRHPVRSDPGRCAWCGRPDNDGHTVVPFGADGRGHSWLHPECWDEWFQNRREQARHALVGYGVQSL